MKDRGAFMTINTSLQQLAGGIAAVIAGKIVTRPIENGALENIDTIGYVISGITIVSIYMMYRVYNLVKDQLPAPRQKGPTGSPEPAKAEPALVTE
jgi:hypothetical protein